MEQAVTNPNELVELEGVKITRGQIDLIKRTIFIGADDDEMRLFFYECRRRGVHPMDRLIYPVVRKDKTGNRRVTFQMGIDYLRAAGEETGRYVGQKPMQYGTPIKQGEINVPEWAEAIILRKDPETGEVVEIPHRTYWKEYYPGEDLGFMWRKMPMNQLGKCAEAGALRKAFPRKLGGLYINEEMEQAEAVPFTSIKEPQKKKTEPETTNPTTSITVKEVIKQTKNKDGVTMKSPRFRIISDDGKEFITFSETFAKTASDIKGTPAILDIEYKVGQYGNDVINLKVVEPPSEEREPGSEG